MTNLIVLKGVWMVLAGIFLTIAADHAMSGEDFKAGVMLGCGVLFVINLARFTDSEA